MKFFRWPLLSLMEINSGIWNTTLKKIIFLLYHSLWGVYYFHIIRPSFRPCVCPWHFGFSVISSRPPIRLLHSINQYCVMEKRDLFVMEERDLKFNKTVKFSLSVANLRNQAMLYGSLDIYLRHTLIVLSGNIDDSKICVEVGKSALFSMTTHFKLPSHIFV